MKQVDAYVSGRTLDRMEVDQAVILSAFGSIGITTQEDKNKI